MIRTLTLLALASILPIPSAAGGSQAKIHPWLSQRAQTHDQLEFLVIMQDQADLGAARMLRGRTAKGHFVFGALKVQAATSQIPIRRWLKLAGAEYRPFTIVNALWVRGDRTLMEQLALREDVARIEGNPSVRTLLPQPEKVASSHAPLGIEWNINQTRAPEVWNAGYTGQGIVIGGQDTGYRWTHDALKQAYRGWDGVSADHDYNWHDSIHSGGGVCGADSLVPCDDNGHGTHTMGTALGDDGGSNRIGMAPGAQWIGCRNMDQGFGTPATYLECFDFFLAPYPVGNPAMADPAKAPDVTVNSWTCPGFEGCSDLTLQAAVNNLRAAGILTVAAAGNSGASCGSVYDPPALYDASYTIGNITSSSTLAGSSSRGPADTTGLTKPDIVAPGTSVRSAYRNSDSTYVSLTGTSMATPHVAGATALIASAAAGFRQHPDATEELFDATAERLTAVVEGCGGDYVHGPNNSWGHGELDAMAAYQALLVEHLVIDNQTIAAKDIALARRSITLGSNLDVSPGGQLLLRAGEQVVLEAGVAIATGGILRAIVDSRILP